MGSAATLAAEIIRATMDATKWTEAEARAFIRCIHAESPEALMEAVPAAVAWAARIEACDAIVHLMKTLPDGALDARWTGTEIALRINPAAKVSTGADGTIEIRLPERGANG